MTMRDHVREAQRLMAEAQQELTAGETLVAKGTLVMAYNELNYALAVAHEGAAPMTAVPIKDPFRCDPQR